jgi:hypothetical protein
MDFHTILGAVPAAHAQRPRWTFPRLSEGGWSWCGRHRNCGSYVRFHDLDPVTASWRRKGALLRTGCRDGGLPSVIPDRTPQQGRPRSSTNLVSNAVKFTDQGRSTSGSRAGQGRRPLPVLFGQGHTGIGISGGGPAEGSSSIQPSGRLAFFNVRYGGDRAGAGQMCSRELAFRTGGRHRRGEFSRGWERLLVFRSPWRRCSANEQQPEESRIEVAPRKFNVLLAEDNPVNQDNLRFSGKGRPRV